MKQIKLLLLVSGISLGLSITNLVFAMNYYKRDNEVNPKKIEALKQTENTVLIRSKEGVEEIEEEISENKVKKEEEKKSVNKNIKATNIPNEYQEYCKEIAEKYDISPYLLMAMIERESAGKYQVTNDSGDTGLMQINKKWHYDRMERLGVVDLYDPYSNILVGADFLKELFDKNDGDIYLAAMKYNMRHKRAEELYAKGIISEYALKVVARADELTELYEGR